MRDFALEVHFEKWEFAAKYNLTASDAESLSLQELLALARPEDRTAFETCWLGYTEGWGAPDLRETIAGTYDTLKQENILCFAGAEEGIYAAMRTLLSPEDHVIVVVPNYQAAETIPLEICDVTGVPLDEKNNWRLDMQVLADAVRPNTKLISVNFPNNPTGAVLPQGDWRALIELCRCHDLYLFSDEVYRQLELHDGKMLPQAADLYEKAFSLNVMSKAYGLPGLRIGWIASQDIPALRRFNRYKHYLSICNSAPSERLAKIALLARDQILDRNRNLIRNNLAELDTFFAEYSDLFEWIPPDGGCVSYPRFIGKGGVEQMCQNLVEESGVLLLPASIYRSDLLKTPSDRFRIGFGRRNLGEGLAAFRVFLDRHHNSLRP